MKKNRTCVQQLLPLFYIQNPTVGNLPPIRLIELLDHVKKLRSKIEQDIFFVVSLSTKPKPVLELYFN